MRMITLIIAALVAGIGGCNKAAEQQASAMTGGGDPHRGKQAINSYGCGGCHTIPGIRDADAVVGPPLTKMGSRMYVGGVVQNTPDNLMRWIQNPPSIDEKTAMPNLHVSEADARDIASYLYTLR